MRRLVLYDLLDFRTDTAQIAPRYIRVDIEHRSDVVMIHDYGRIAALHRDQVRQKLRVAGHRARVAVSLRSAAGGGSHRSVRTVRYRRRWSYSDCSPRSR